MLLASNDMLKARDLMVISLWTSGQWPNGRDHLLAYAAPRGFALLPNHYPPIEIEIGMWIGCVHPISTGVEQTMIEDPMRDYIFTTTHDDCSCKENACDAEQMYKPCCLHNYPAGTGYTYLQQQTVSM